MNEEIINTAIIKNETNLIIAINKDLSLFNNCTRVVITEEEKLFIESCKTPKRVNGIFVEGFTEADLLAENIKKAIAIDFDYTQRIDDLMMKHYNKIQKHNYFNLTPYIVPQSAWDEEQALKDECNAKILALGITDFTYRQSVPKLAKIL